MNNYYLNSSSQNFLGCTPPDSTRITLAGFATNTPLFITWFPTRLNSTLHPPQDTLVTTTGALTLDLSGYLGGTANNYLDTLRSDYAFIITPGFFQKRMAPRPLEEYSTIDHGWDFHLYPNPAQDILFLRMPDETPKEIMILDISGRRMMSHANVTSTTCQLPVAQLAKRAYWVSVRASTNVKVKKIIIH